MNFASIAVVSTKARRIHKTVAKIDPVIKDGPVSSLDLDGNVFDGIVRSDSSKLVRTMEGNGTYKFASSSAVYEGPFEGSRIDGIGTLSLSNGDVYKGNFFNGYRHGHGIFLSADRCFRYEGDWNMGYRHGHGTLIVGKKLDFVLSETSCIILNKYEGSWISGNKEGKGVMSWSSGTEYCGEWKGDYMHGKGTINWRAKKEVYEGDWDKGFPHGNGIMVWFAADENTPANQQMNNRYVGDWFKGRREGKGFFFYADGSVYEGDWRNDLREGFGKYTSFDGRIFAGNFVAGGMGEDVGRMGGEGGNPLRSYVEIEDVVLYFGKDVRSLTAEALNKLLTSLGQSRRIYSNYRKFLKLESLDPFLLSMLQLWVICREANLLSPWFSLADLCRCSFEGKRNFVELFSLKEENSERNEYACKERVDPGIFSKLGNSSAVDIFSPARVFFFRHFIETIVRISVILFSLAPVSLSQNFDSSSPLPLISDCVDFVASKAFASLAQQPSRSSMEFFQFYLLPLFSSDKWKWEFEPKIFKLFSSISLKTRNFQVTHKYDKTTSFRNLLLLLSKLKLLSQGIDSDLFRDSPSPPSSSSTRKIASSNSVIKIERDIEEEAPENLVISLRDLKATITLESSNIQETLNIDVMKLIDNEPTTALINDTESTNGKEGEHEASEADKHKDAAELTDSAKKEIEWWRPESGLLVISLIDSVRFVSEVFSPGSVEKIKKLDRHCNREMGDMPLIDFLDYEMIFFEFIRVFFRIVQEKADDVPGEVADKFVCFLEKRLLTSLE